MEVHESPTGILPERLRRPRRGVRAPHARRAQTWARTLIGKADFIPAEDIAYYRDDVVWYHGQGTTVHTAADEQTNYVIVARTEASTAERHARWDDRVIARAAAAFLHGNAV